MVASSPGVASCPHCGVGIVGTVDRFCCHGCEQAWTILHDAGLEGYYARREVAGHRPEGLDRSWSAIEPVLLPSGQAELRIGVDGLRCASCTWVVEHLLERTPGVVSANVSYATGRSCIVFDPAATDVASVVGVIANIGYQPRPTGQAAAPDELLGRLGVAAFCTSNLMLLSAGLYAGWGDGMEERFQVLFRWGTAALATPIALYSAAPFLEGALRSLRLRVVGMDVPIALAVTVLYVHGLAQTLLGAEGYLDSLGMLVTLLLLGRVLERRGRRAASEAAGAIAAALPRTARRRTETGVEDVPSAELAVGDVLEVGVGEELPADGVVLEGNARVEMALLTGEAEPVVTEPGAAVVAGARLVEGSLVVLVQRVGTDTLAMRMADAVAQATDQPTGLDPNERLAPAFTAFTITAALLAGLGWTWLAGPEQGLQVLVATLVVACPCALGLSVPLSVSAGLAAVARRGLVLRDGATLLALADIETLAVDKTGTVTSGRPVVSEADDEVLRLAASLERSSQHPVARALLDEAARRGLPLELVDALEEHAGRGVAGVVAGVRMAVRAGGPGEVVLFREEQPIGTIRLSDRPREDAARSVEMVRRAGLQVVMLSGDHPVVTAGIATQVGIPDAQGGLDPRAKAAWIDAHPNTLFVGDGLNDGPALARARVGLAMHTGVTASLLAADGVVTQPSLRPVVAGLAGARATARVVRRNQIWSLAYNGAAVAGAMLGFVNPLVAAVLMPLSSLMVVWGALSVERQLALEERKWTS